MRRILADLFSALVEHPEVPKGVRATILHHEHEIFCLSAVQCPPIRLLSLGLRDAKGGFGASRNSALTWGAGQHHASLATDFRFVQNTALSQVFV